MMVLGCSTLTNMTIYLSDMHEFIAKSRQGTICPATDSKQKLLKRILDDYEKRDISFRITIEPVSKTIQSQISVYQAFVMSVSEHFGISYREAEETLEDFRPSIFVDGISIAIPVTRWTNQQLDDFINRSTSVLADFGFKF